MTSPRPHLNHTIPSLGIEEPQSTTKTHKTKNKTKHTKIINKHTYTQANRQIQMQPHPIDNKTTHIYTTNATNNGYMQYQKTHQ